MMDTNKLKKFAQEARVQLIAQVGAKMGLVLAEGSAARREASPAVEMLEREIRASSTQQVIEKVAYTWFNRFTALRFMDANGYTNPRVVTPAEGQTLPEILADAKSSTFDEAIREPVCKAVTALLDGRTPSRDGQGEAYRLLLVAICNHWHVHMPFMFEKIADYTELLMPEDLLSSESILSHMRAVMTDEDCRDVEIIGWLYQFYISEKKDQVFAALKKNVKISAENIPAATQLFTPHWIVRYLVENTLGRLWLLNRPQSKLATQMDYYIAPVAPETDFLRITKPEEIRICDPACGSGHMLTYAFDLLHGIYEEEGYDAAQIPALILSYNLQGVEVDERAGALAAFALAMKAALKLGRRRFLRMVAQPNICVVQDVRFTPAEMQDVAAVVGRDMFTADLRETLEQFEQAKNFGSLIVPKLRYPAEVARVVRSKDFGNDLLLRDAQERVLTVLQMAEALSSKYHVVVANPPYMGSGGMDVRTGTWVKENYPDSRSDLMTCFMERSGALVQPDGVWGMINLPSWMFLGSFEKLRAKLLRTWTMLSLIHLGRGVFGADFGSVAFVVKCQRSRRSNVGIYRRLFEKSSIVRLPEEIEGLFKDPTYGYHSITQDEFCKVPGQPIAYWLSEAVFKAFADFPSLFSVAPTKQGLATGDNERFLRNWFEVSRKQTGFGVQSSEETLKRPERWYPCNKGGEFRKWYGNNNIVAEWRNGGASIKNFVSEDGKLRSRPQNEASYFKPGLTWSAISISSLSMRLSPPGAMFETKGAMCFPAHDRLHRVLAFANTKIVNRLLLALSPTLDFHEGPVGRLPYCHADGADSLGRSCVSLARGDWDGYESSWGFTTLPLLARGNRTDTLAGSYTLVRAYWLGMTQEMQRLEEENNRIFIEAYGLQDELTPEVPIEEITLTCNPAHRYGGKATAAELEARLLADTMCEFLHYAVGCMFGRYSLDAPGLIVANQGEGLADYLARVPEPTFAPDADNVIPVVDGDWFADDIASRFRKFLRVTFGEPNFQENLSFIETALGKDIGKWFTREFFEYHVRRYKKRPIYWMFSSPKGTFNALIYMHRYRPDTVSVVLNDYLREFISRLQAERARLDKLADDPAASQAHRTKALKDIVVLIKQIDELTNWERDVVFPLAQAKIEIDLDDGVKANYPKFGAALKAIKGLEGKEDE